MVTGGPFRFLLRYRWGVGAGVLCLMLTNGMAQAIPWVVKWTVETIEQRGPDLWRLASLLVAMAVIQGGIRVLSRLLIFNAGREAEYDLRRTIFARLCQLDGAFFRAYRTGDLMSRLTNDLSSVRALFGPGILIVVNTIFAYAVALPLMLSIDAWVTLWALTPYPLLMLGARTFARGIYRRSQEMQVSLAAMTSTVQEDLAGIRELKNYRLEDRRSQVFSEASSGYLDLAMRLARYRAAIFPFVGAGAGASLVIVLWLAGARVIDGRLTLGDLVALNLYIGLLAWPTMAIGWMLTLWHRGLASWHRLLEILQQRSTLETDVGQAAAADLPRGPLDLELRGLSVGFGDSQAPPVLQDVSLSVPAGSLCAVVGRVGCGKTTLAEALARLIDVPPGSVFFGGRDVTGLPVEWVRSQVAYAPQSAFLFSLSIRDNIAMGLGPEVDPGSDEATRAIEGAVKAAGLEPDLARFPDGLQTMVGERGLSLSGGQRQRIALARALINQRPVLILDDSLSSVDADTEKTILKQLGGVLKGRTALLISHRLSAIQHADQVLVLDQGRVVEAGTHEHLLGRGGVYAELYRRQVLAEEVGA